MKSDDIPAERGGEGPFGRGASHAPVAATRAAPRASFLFLGSTFFVLLSCFCPFSSFSFFFFFKFILRERERARAQVGEGQRGRENLKQAPCCRHRARSDSRVMRP